MAGGATAAKGSRPRRVRAVAGRGGVAALLLACAVAGAGIGSTVGEVMGKQESKPAGTAAPARDGEVAIREEYEAATRKNSAAALQLFIQRHPGHKLAREAQEKMKALRRPEGDAP